MGNDIPVSKLEGGFHKGFAHVQRMIDSSIILHESEHHSMSTAISILVHEELVKLRYVVAHIRDQEPIDLKEWTELSGWGSHNAKLKKFYADYFNDIVKICSEHAETVQEINPDIAIKDIRDFPNQVNQEYQTFPWSKLNDIKKECIYLDWKNGSWSTFDNNAPKDERAALSEFLHLQILSKFFMIKLEYEDLAAPLTERTLNVKMSKYAALGNKVKEMQAENASKSFEETIRTAMFFIKKYSEQ